MEYMYNNAKGVAFHRPAWTILALAMIILGVRLHLILIHGNHTPYWDDWGLGHRLAAYLENGFDWSWIFSLGNEHRGSFTKLIHLGLFELNSLQWDPYLGMITNTVLWTLAGAWLIHIAIRSGAQINSWAAICLILLLWIYPLSLFNIVSTIQTFLYIKILCVLIGFWWCCARPFSLKWFCGMLLIGAACLTSGGGSFVPVAVASVSYFMAFFDRENRKLYMRTALFASVISVYGLSLIFGLDRTGSLAQSFEFESFINSFFKVLSWPASDDVWASIFFLTPIVLLAYRVARSPAVTGRLGVYVLMMAAFSIMMACSIGFARSFGEGLGPADRYFEFLSLYCIASFLALMLLQNDQFRWGRKFNGFMILGWALAFISAMPYQLEVLNYNLADRAKLVATQESIVSSYAILGDKGLFNNREFREVPFNDPEFLAIAIEDMKRLDMLPYQFQTPRNEIKADQFPFNVSELVDHLAGKYRHYENVITSYNTVKGAENAQGEYTSPVYSSYRPFVMIAHTGFLGFPGLSLKLVGITDGEVINVEPTAKHSDYSQHWREEIVPAPKDGYRIVATDHSPIMHFNFAAPRSVGALTYYGKRLLKKGKSIWRYGLLLLLILLRHDIMRALQVPGREDSAEAPAAAVQSGDS